MSLSMIDKLVRPSDEAQAKAVKGSGRFSPAERCFDKFQWPGMSANMRWDKNIEKTHEMRL